MQGLGAKGLVVALALGALSACVAPEEQAAAKTGNSDACQVTEVIDGDTVNLSCNGGAGFTARLTEFDAPETAKALCPAERAAGLKARDALLRLVSSGPVTAVRRTGGKSEGRPLFELEIGGKSVAEAMIEQGHAKAFDGGNYPVWCDIL